MADYDSSSLWYADGASAGAMAAAEALPLSKETVRDLAEWSHKLWDFLDAEDVADDTGEVTPADVMHDRDGRALWRRVASELGPGFEVGYAVFDPDPDDA